MRPKGSAEVLQERRLLAARLLRAGQSRSAVAKLLGLHRATVSRWKAQLRRGVAALRARPQPGAASRLSARQLRRLARLLADDPTRHGFPTSLWTGGRVAKLVRRHFGVRYHPSHAWRILRRLGLTPQKPQPAARERDEASVAHWRRYRWPRVKSARPARAGGSCSSTNPGSCSSPRAGGRGRRAGARPSSAAGTGATGGA